MQRATRALNAPKPKAYKISFMTRVRCVLAYICYMVLEVERSACSAEVL